MAPFILTCLAGTGGSEMTFEEWWETYWKTSVGTKVLDLAFKEVAHNAWEAAMKESSKKSRLITCADCGGLQYITLQP